MPSIRSPLTARFEELVEKKRAEWGVPGFAISVVHKGETFLSAYGIATYPEIPVTSSTLFSVASVSKAFLAAAWSQTIEADKEERTEEDEALAFNTPFFEICPEDFVLEDPWATENLTIEDALSHRTGMSGHNLCYGGSEVTTSQEIMHQLRHFPLHNSPRTKWEYSNTMYIAASHALEVAQSRSLQDILEADIWRPLGMKHTYLDIRDVVREADSGAVQLATPYSNIKVAGYDCHTFRTEDNAFSYSLYGAGAMVSNVEDFAIWMDCLLNAKNPLNESMISEMWKPRAIVGNEQPPFDGAVLYCLGWMIGTYQREKVVFHAGSVAGSGSMVILLPERKWGATIMANAGVVGWMVAMQLAFHLIDDLLLTPEKERANLLPIHQRIIDEREKAGSKKLAELDKEVGDLVSPRSLPLEEYAGRYFHPGYRDIVFKIDPQNKSLVADVENRTWPFKIRLEHLNAERWISCAEIMPYRGVEMVQEAEFLIGKDRKVKQLGLVMENEMPDTKFWFERI